MTPEAIITIKDLSFSYGAQQVLKGISVAIAAGDQWAVIGKNGTGKSTLVKCIAGLEKYAGGSITLAGKEISSYSHRVRAQKIAYVPQVLGRVFPYTVYDYVMMGRFPYQGFTAMASSEDKRKVMEALELTDTIAMADRFMPTLSGGELQRVLLAGAVSQRTEVLLLDEPTTFLDPQHQDLIQKALARIHNEYHCTIITVTHDINMALFYYDHVVALVDGTVFFAGTTHMLQERYSPLLEEIFNVPFIMTSDPGSQTKFVAPERVTPPR